MILYSSLLLIGIGVVLDTIEFCIRFMQFLKKMRVMSATPFLGALLSAVGTVGLKLHGVSWSVTACVLLVLLGVHLLFQVVLPTIVTLITAEGDTGRRISGARLRLASGPITAGGNFGIGGGRGRRRTSPPEEVNYVDFHVVRREVGARGIESLTNLLRWIYNDGTEFNESSCVRYAPSIITRSEAEIFNLSVPRFALRLYCDGTQGPFVNIRRLASLSDQMRLWSHRITPAAERNDSLRVRRVIRLIRAPIHTAHALRRNPCIADCVLPVPDRLNTYYILTAELGRVYGERDDVLGSPYVMHIQLAGGGLCAQAVCFMATVLLKDYAKGIYGISEITSLAQGIETRELILHGLWNDEMCTYFLSDEISLRSIWQRPRLYETKEEAQMFGRVIRAYVISGFPVIVPIDLARAAGEGTKDCPVTGVSIFAENLRGCHLPECPIVPEPEIPANRVQTHCVLVIGCGDEIDPDTLVFHDPAVLPFMRASSQQLAEARCYGNANRTYLSSHLLLPVTPKQILLPLGSWHKEVEMKRGSEIPSKGRTGLLDLAEILQSSLTGPDYPKLASPTDPGLLWLWHARQMRNMKFWAKFPDSRMATVASIEPVINLVKRLDRWCWIQYSDTCKVADHECKAVWIWNAEKPPPTAEGRSVKQSLDYLEGLFVKRDNSWRQVYHGRSSDVSVSGADCGTDEEESMPKTNAGIVPVESTGRALISSFSLIGLQDSIRRWPESKIRNCDLYAFMQRDAEEYLRLNASLKLLWLLKCIGNTTFAQLANWIRALRGGASTGVILPLLSARLRMANSYGNARIVSEVAGKIDSMCSTKNLKIIALSSYLPGLASQTRLAKRSQRALLFLVRLARQLRDCHKHPLQVIELVAGSLIDGTWPARDERGGENVYVANVAKRTDAIRILMDSIRSVAGETARAGLILAMELEPGPLFVVNDAEALTDICRMAETDALLRQVFRLNLDVAHWSLAGIKTQNLASHAHGQRSPSSDKVDFGLIRDYISHGHVSGHSKGHFADLGLQYSEYPEEINSWLLLLAHSVSNREESGRTGVLSLELEGVASMKIVEESLDHDLFTRFRGF